MKKIGYILDTKLYLNENVIKDAIFVSLSFIIGSKKYSNLNNIQSVFDYRSPEYLIETNQPTIEEYIDAFNKLIEKGYERVICLVSMHYQNNYLQNALLAKSIIKDERFIVLDSKTFGIGIDLLLYELNKVKDIDKLNDTIEHFKTTSEFYLITSNESNKNTNLLDRLKNKINPYKVNQINKDTVTNFNSLDKAFKNILDKYQNNIISQNYSYYIMYENNADDAKILHHEIYMSNKNNKVELYNQLPYQIIHKNKYNLAILIRKEEL